MLLWLCPFWHIIQLLAIYIICQIRYICKWNISLCSMWNNLLCKLWNRRQSLSVKWNKSLLTRRRRISHCEAVFHARSAFHKSWKDLFRWKKHFRRSAFFLAQMVNFHTKIKTVQSDADSFTVKLSIVKYSFYFFFEILKNKNETVANIGAINNINRYP